MSTTPRNRIYTLVECGILIALSCVLSLFTIFEMPLGGSITPASMLPIMIIGIRHGNRWGLGSAFVYSLFQMLTALVKGNVFPYCQTGGTLVICILFDYLVPFTILGLAGLFRNHALGKFRHFGVYLGMVAVVFLRFVCHFLTGITIWAQWADGAAAVIAYSAAYNSTYLLPDLAICLVLSVLLLETPQMKRIMHLKVDYPEENA